MGLKLVYTDIIGSKWSLVPRNVWKKVETKYGALKLANWTIITIHRNTNLAPEVSPKRRYGV